VRQIANLLGLPVTQQQHLSSSRTAGVSASDWTSSSLHEWLLPSMISYSEQIAPIPYFTPGDAGTLIVEGKRKKNLSMSKIKLVTSTAPKPPAMAFLILL
jgi:hypothetical protein